MMFRFGTLAFGPNSTGTPTSLGIPTLASADILKKEGINEITTAVDSKIASRMFAPSSPSDKQAVKWSQSGGTWIADFVDPAELKQSGATTGQPMVWNGTKWGPTALTTVVGAVSVDVTMGTINTYFDGPSVSLTAGTWLIVGKAFVFSGSAAEFTAKLWDGTTAYDAAGYDCFGTNDDLVLPMQAIVTPGSTTTYKISVAANTGTTHVIKATPNSNSAGLTNLASGLVAVKLG